MSKTTSPRKRIGRNRAAPSSREMRQAAFLDALRSAGAVSGAARRTGITRNEHREWLAHDPRYSAQVRDIEEDLGDDLELELRRRALIGTEEPVFYKGEYLGTVRKPSNELLIVLLRAKCPDLFLDPIVSKEETLRLVSDTFGHRLHRLSTEEQHELFRIVMKARDPNEATDDITSKDRIESA